MPGSGRELEIRLYRDSLSTSWGFRLQGGKDLNAPLTIQKVTPCTPAEGELERGDVILEIQSNPASRLTHALAKELIKNAGGSLLLRLQRSGSSYVPPAPTYSSYSQPVQRPAQRPRNIQKPFSDFGVDYNRGKFAAPVHNPTPAYETGYYHQQPSGAMLSRLQDSLSSSMRRSNSPSSSAGYDYPSPSTPTGGHSKYPTWGPGMVKKPTPAPNNASSAPWRNPGTRSPGRITAQTDFGGVVSDEPPAWLGTLRSANNPHNVDSHPGVAAVAAGHAPKPAPADSGAYPHKPRVTGFHYGPDGSQEFRQNDRPDNAKAAHLQYNSPIGLYSRQNVQDAMSKQLNGRPGEGTIGILN